MTKEQAEQLKPGDIISCAGNGNRELTKCWVHRDMLHWHQMGNGETEHQYEYSRITLVKRAEPIVINNYQIY
jgi:hypothetical protein